MIDPAGAAERATRAEQGMETNGGVLVLSWVISILISLFFAWLCARIARDKGYPAVLFAILGFFFSCITLIIVLVIPRRPSP